MTSAFVSEAASSSPVGCSPDRIGCLLIASTDPRIPDYVPDLVDLDPAAVLFPIITLWLPVAEAAARRERTPTPVGRSLLAAGEESGALVRPLAYGLTAALVGTLVANAFYLTIQFYYFFVLALLIVAAPLVFARRRSCAS